MFWVLYLVQFQRSLDDEQVAWRARYLVDNPIDDLPVAHTVDALRAGLASGEQLSGDIARHHDEATFRSFLGRLADRMEALRPWPTPPYRKLPASRHADVFEWLELGRIGYGAKGLAERLHRYPEGVGNREVLVLQLESGDVVALLDDRHRKGWSVLVSGSARPADDVIAAFRTATGFTAKDIAPPRRSFLRRLAGR